MPSLTVNNLDGESSRKRVRHVDHGDENASERVRSDLNSESRKRVRLSADADGDFAAPDPETHTVPDSPPKTQYDLMRDNGFEHLRNESVDDQRATQRLRLPRPNLLGENVVAENGILENITCVNFMCHTRLSCDLGPLLNFIVGENGSGKSAILTAITLCLGGKASSTNRGGSLKSFVKEGQERAVLSVRIKNQGQDAYKADSYGDSIIVERHFSKSGSSGFKVKSAMGQVVSTKRQEVEDIVEYFALQVDNPLNVLSQDQARQFLNASTKSQKYKFFIEGVQLQQLDNDYRLIAENLEVQTAKIPEQEERVRHAKVESDKALRLLETMEDERTKRRKLNEARLQLVWAAAVEEERELDQRKKKLAELRVKLADAEPVVTEKTQALKAEDEKLESLQQEKEALETKESEIKDKEATTKEEYEKVTRELHNIHDEERDAHEHLKAAEEEIEVCERQVVAEQKRLEESNGGEQAIKIRELEETQTSRQEIEKQIAENRALVPQLTQKIEDSKKVLATVDLQLDQKQKEIASTEAKIQALKQKLGSPYDAYDRKLPALLRAIANETRFKDRPIGPLGTHIQLLKAQWSNVIETALGTSLDAFLVFSRPDQRILSELMQRVGMYPPPIFISNNRRPLNLDGKEPDNEYDTILRILKFDNESVRDQFILQASIEQSILIPSRTAAEKVMFDGARPRNVKACYSIHDKKRHEGLRLVCNPSPATAPVILKRGWKARIKTDSGSQITFLEETLKQMETEYQSIGLEKRRLQQAHQRLESNLVKLKKQESLLDTRLRECSATINRIEEALDAFEGVDLRLRDLKQELEKLQAKRDHHGIQYGNLAAKKKDKNAESLAARDKLKAEKARMRDYEASVRKVEDKIKRAEDLRHFALSEKNDSILTFENLGNDILAAEASCERQERRVEEAIRDAQEQTHSAERMHVPDNETMVSLGAKYKVLLEDYKKMRKKGRGLSEEQVNNLVTRTNEAYRQAVQNLETSRMINDGLRHTLSLRLDKWRKFQRYISSQSRANFIYLLSERGFRGKLLLDHERKALDLQVEPDKTEKRAAGRSTKTLSGGEKSFSSICLLLAIWEAMGSPLRCLDEFDVFMDNVNRAISTNMLITAARRSVNRQYIFITPNAIEGRNALDKDVKVIRLTDPRQRLLADH
ncbi:hypothetical protein QBC35DRAFT_389855 [Podospora australis]|uniref:RecF/RecN/SMC N-terminal domain-containing protein n=1 Tax=Podospora australis TaxID=1536484 RepID=A0AAN6WNU6_9PEZI|nr:hypothetical protein QBC35DRAFT_389855 [Podospora australis]